MQHLRVAESSSTVTPDSGFRGGRANRWPQILFTASSTIVHTTELLLFVTVSSNLRRKPATRLSYTIRCTFDSLGISLQRPELLNIFYNLGASGLPTIKYTCSAELTSKIVCNLQLTAGAHIVYTYSTSHEAAAHGQLLFGGPFEASGSR
jgi:hypothetical protein